MGSIHFRFITCSYKFSWGTLLINWIICNYSYDDGRVGFCASQIAGSKQLWALGGTDQPADKVSGAVSQAPERRCGAEPGTGRAKVSPKPWHWAQAHEIGCCSPGGEPLRVQVLPDESRASRSVVTPRASPSGGRTEP